MADKHTPTIIAVDDLLFSDRGGENERVIANVYAGTVFAERMARAVNRDHLFGELVKALEAAWTALDSAEAVSDTGTLGEDIDHWCLDPIAYASATSFVRAVLAKVEASDG